MVACSQRNIRYIGSETDLSKADHNMPNLVKGLEDSAEFSTMEVVNFKDFNHDSLDTRKHLSSSLFSD